MAERWQTSEARTAAVFYRDSTGAPTTGLTPTATADYKDGTAGAPAATVTEVGHGFYRVSFASALTKDVLVRVDAGATLTTTRYVALEVPVGGYVDDLDVVLSTRASAAALATVNTEVVALGSPAQTSDARFVHLDADVSSRATHAEATSDTPGTTTLLARVTATRAGLLDSLSLLDVAISSRATHAEATTDTAGTTTLLGRLTSVRAGLLDALTLLDVAVSTRASGAALAGLELTSDPRLAYLDAAISTRATHADVQTAVTVLEPPSVSVS